MKNNLENATTFIIVMDNKYGESWTNDTEILANALVSYAKSIIPSDEEFNEALDKAAFQIPYDGSNNFYDDNVLKDWRDCWSWLKDNIYAEKK